MIIVMWADREHVVEPDGTITDGAVFEKIGEIITECTDDDVLKRAFDMFMNRICVDDGYIYFIDGEYDEEGFFISERHLVRQVGSGETNVVSAFDHGSKIIEA